MKSPQFANTDARPWTVFACNIACERLKRPAKLKTLLDRFDETIKGATISLSMFKPNVKPNGYEMLLMEGA